MLAALGDARHVDLEDRGDVGRGAAREQHVLGDAAAHGGERLELHRRLPNGPRGPSGPRGSGRGGSSVGCGAAQRPRRTCRRLAERRGESTWRRRPCAPGCLLPGFDVAEDVGLGDAALHAGARHRGGRADARPRSAERAARSVRRRSVRRSVCRGGSPPAAPRPRSAADAPPALSRGAPGSRLHRSRAAATGAGGAGAGAGLRRGVRGGGTAGLTSSTAATTPITVSTGTVLPAPCGSPAACRPPAPAPRRPPCRSRSRAAARPWRSRPPRP